MASDTSASAEFATVDDALIAALGAGIVADLATITETSTITLVRVSDLKANGGADALEDVIAKVGDGAAMLKANVDTNAVLKDKINAAGFETDLVVAVLVNDAGSFTVIINDEHP
jgi:hypothetical protein